MLEIELSGGELYDESKEEFIELQGRTIQLEHSLISISKWESKWKKPYFAEEKKTVEQLMDYILCMCVTKRVTRLDLEYLSVENLEKITDYMEETRSATWFNENRNNGSSREVTTSEIIYYQMFKLGIPIECEKWHISRLLTLIRVYAAKDPNASQKMSRRDVVAQNRALNEARKRKYQTKG